MTPIEAAGFVDGFGWVAALICIMDKEAHAVGVVDWMMG